MSNILIKKLIRKFTGVVSLAPRVSSRGRVLLSYDTAPFLRKQGVFPRTHSNQWECYEIARLFLERNYAVDVIDWSNTNFIPKKDYAFIIDIHQNLERLTPLLGPDCIKIFHITGAHWLSQNSAEYSRLLDIKERKGIVLSPRRETTPTHSIESSDYATVLGDGYAKTTYAYAKKPLYSIPLSTTVTFPAPAKDFSSCRNKFIWLGGGGLALKGLDILLEYFSKHPEYQLTVCGNIHAESDFEELYHRELYETPNIKCVGKVDVGGATFLEITQKALALIYPSSSEGQAGSVITAMHAGLIPIISRESGVTVNDFGVVLSDNSIQAVGESIENIVKESDERLSQRAKDAWNYAQEHHTRETFTRAYAHFIDSILHKNQQ